MKVQHIIGADLSKKTIDVFCHSTGTHHCIENNESGFRLLLQWFKEQNVSTCQAGIFMEHTGLYSYLFEEFLHRYSILFVKVAALEILRSQGIVRGKSDKIDARRIALYGVEKQHKLIPHAPVDKDLDRLKMLNTVRSGLVRQKTSLKCSLKEYRNIGIKESDLIIKSQQKVLAMLEKQIQELALETERLVKSNEGISSNYGYLRSVRGIGPVTATVTIIKTANFTRFKDGRKFACYCGTAPFEYSSGSSIRGKTKISHLADKEMKTLLDLAARSAMQHDPELKEYYQRRIAEGKSKRSTINILRNKLIHRMFAVVKRKSPFVDGFKKVA
ncbi:IS110 family transposase [Ferruginibacter sp. HRS2-29]|uniref:IS110 family transposase n=2 Tax=Ferruginibacter sp. HRS2-29 TaxID=2487334 RepID=UPI0020CBA682|nr:IS110 family transposase [Ferruginibacter sp. HRS2-29]